MITAPLPVAVCVDEIPGCLSVLYTPQPDRIDVRWPHIAKRSFRRMRRDQDYAGLFQLRPVELESLEGDKTTSSEPSVH